MAKYARRKDKKGRVLRDGESQRADGRYCFKYTVHGKTKYIYSWKLTKTDHTPRGKKDGEDLRTLEEELKAEIERSSLAVTEKTLGDALSEFVANKRGIKMTSRRMYESAVRSISDDEFLQQRVAEVTPRAAKAWFRKLGETRGYSRCNLIKQLFRGCYQEMVEDGLITQNPFDFRLNKVVEDSRKSRESLTPTQQAELLSFLESSKRYSRYLPHIRVLLLTGMRISEFCALTVSDVDFETRTLNISKQVQIIDGKRCVVPPKTAAGTRLFPVNDELRDSLQRMIDSRNPSNPIDGYCDFLNCSKNGLISHKNDWESKIENIIDSYNATHEVPLPKFSPHVFRHTFVSNMVNKGIPVSVVSYLAGHSDSSVTLKVYSHTGSEEARRVILGE